MREVRGFRRWEVKMPVEITRRDYSLIGLDAKLAVETGFRRPNGGTPARYRASG